MKLLPWDPEHLFALQLMRSAFLLSIIEHLFYNVKYYFWYFFHVPTNDSVSEFTLQLKQRRSIRPYFFMPGVAFAARFCIFVCASKCISLKMGCFYYRHSDTCALLPMVDMYNLAISPFHFVAVIRDIVQQNKVVFFEPFSVLCFLRVSEADI